MSFQVTSKHFPIVEGLPVLKPKSGLSTRRHIGTAMCHFKSPQFHFAIVQALHIACCNRNNDVAI